MKAALKAGTRSSTSRRVIAFQCKALGGYTPSRRKEWTGSESAAPGKEAATLRGGREGVTAAGGARE